MKGPTNEDKQIEDDLRTYPDYERPERPIEGRHDLFLMFVSTFLAISVALGVNSTLPGEGTMHNFMVLFVGVLAGTLSYFANKAAFAYGSKLVARGDRIALSLCIAWFITLGSTGGTIGFTGLSRDVMEGAKLRTPLVELTSAKQRLGATSAEGTGVLPVVSAARRDIEALVRCELARGCISGRRGPGRQVSELQTIVGKFGGVENSYSNSARDRALLIGKLDKLTSAYEKQLSESGVGTGNRAALLKIYSNGQAILTDLAHVVPTSAIRGLVSELRGFRSSTGRFGRINLSERLRGHAARIESLIPEKVDGSVVLAPFPEPSGIAAGWERLDLTWPYAVLLFGLELIVIVLWALLVRDFMARREGIAAKHKSKGNGDDDGPGGHGFFASYGRRAGAASGRPQRANGTDRGGLS